MRKKAIKIISRGVYLFGVLLCISDLTANEPITKQIIGLVLMIVSLPMVLSSLGGNKNV